MTLTIRPASPADTDTFSELLGAAFADVDSLRMLVGKPARKRLTTLFEARARAFYLEDGYVDVAESDGEIVGAAMWAGPSKRMSLIDDIRILPTYISTLRGRLVPSAIREVQVGSFHPHDPHWYLHALGVSPAGQGQGVGSALLERGLERAGDDLCYLEAANARASKLYRRYGFVPMGPLPAGEGEEPEIAMWRCPS